MLRSKGRWVDQLQSVSPALEWPSVQQHVNRARDSKERERNLFESNTNLFLYIYEDTFDPTEPTRTSGKVPTMSAGHTIWIIVIIHITSLSSHDSNGKASRLSEEEHLHFYCIQGYDGFHLFLFFAFSQRVHLAGKMS